MVAPEYEEFLSIPAASFDSAADLLSLDKGCSLTKVLVGKRSDEKISFTCRTYSNADIEDALAWMAATANIAADTEVRVTGVGGDILRPMIADRLRCRTAFVDDLAAQQRGAELLLRNEPAEGVFYPEPELLFKSQMEGKSSTWNHMVKDRQKDTDVAFPTLFVNVGATTTMFYIHEESEATFVYSTGIGGRTLLGIANLILNTVDFSEIDELASRGDRTKLDLIGKDVFGQCEDDSYTAFPSDMSIFNFGKLAEPGVNKEDITLADKATALMGFFAQIYNTSIAETVKHKKNGTIVMGGNFVRSKVFRDYLFSNHTALKMFHGDKKLTFLKTGHVTAIGALVGSPKNE